MKILIGQTIKDNKIIRTSRMRYDDTIGFFVALVNICDELEIDIPIWTADEDKEFDKNEEVLINLEEGTVFRLIKGAEY